MNRDYYAGMTEGRIQERERIIKLLDDYTMYRFDKELIIDIICGASSGTDSSAVENPQAETAR